MSGVHESFFKLEHCKIQNLCGRAYDRQELQVVLADFQQKRLTASDGHLLAIIPFDPPAELQDHPPISIDRAFFSALESAFLEERRNELEPPSISILPDAIRLISGARQIDFRFPLSAPDFGAAIKKHNYARTVECSVDPAYLFRLWANAGGDSLGVRFVFDAENPRSPVRLQDGEKLIGLVMPIAPKEYLDGT